MVSVIKGGDDDDVNDGDGDADVEGGDGDNDDDFSNWADSNKTTLDCLAPDLGHSYNQLPGEEEEENFDDYDDYDDDDHHHHQKHISML